MTLDQFARLIAYTLLIFLWLFAATNRMKPLALTEDWQAARLKAIRHMGLAYATLFFVQMLIVLFRGTGLLDLMNLVQSVLLTIGLWLCALVTARWVFR